MTRFSDIRFGTDGWRAVDGRDFTFDNVARVAAATARWLHTRSAAPSAVVGYDTRKDGRAYAEHAARTLAAEGVSVRLASGFVPTPAVSWATREFGCDAGVVITASHNPPEWNGYKIKAPHGGPASPSDVAEVQALIPDEAPGPAGRAAAGIEQHDIRSGYLHMLAGRVDLDLIRSSGLHIVHDAMFGAGQGAFGDLLGVDRVVALRSRFQPDFEGCAPEPIDRNLDALPVAVRREGCAVGIANDGDADRIGMVDERGRFVDSHRILALLLRYLVEDRGLRGEVVKTVSTTDLLDTMAAAYGLVVHTTPIGFKYICERMLARDVLIGGEESGGIAVKGHLPERDGIYIGLLVLELLARTGQPLSALVDDVLGRFGPQAYWRVDAHTTPERMEQALDRLSGRPGLDRVAGERVRSVDTLDGYKHRLATGWVLVRPSGTEPVLRIYAEAADRDTAIRLVEDTARVLGV